MHVSVVMPLFNKADTVLAAVESVRAQRFARWELVVVDDGSSDDGAARVRALGDERIRLISQPNGGVAHARNVGMRAAQHEWVAFLDADDAWEANHLGELVRLRARYPAALLLATGFWYVNSMGRRYRSSVRPHHLEQPDHMLLMRDYCEEVHRHGVPFITSSVMVQRQAALALGGFMPGVVAGEDLLMWAQLACAGPVAFSATCSTLYAEPPMTAALRRAVIRRPQRPDVVAEALRQLIDRPCALAGVRHFLADWHRMRAVLWMELNERRACLSDLLQAMRWDRPAFRDLGTLLALALPQGCRALALARRRRAA